MDHKRNRKMNCGFFRIPNSIYATLILISCMLLNPMHMFSQGTATKTADQITVKGQILDEKKLPIIGASVLVEDSKTGTITDLDGNFTIKASSNSTLVISYIGYVSQKVKATLKPLVITMAEDVAKLDEVVVVGYGAVKRANLTGAVSSLSMKEVADFPASYNFV